MSKKADRADAVSRPSKENHVDTILYEMDMLDYCFGRLRESRYTHEQEYNLCIEGFLLHYRNLIEFFGNHGRGLRAGMPEHWSPKPLSDGDRRSILDASLLKDYSEDLARYLTHCNEIRARKDIEWKHIEMYERIKPLLENFRRLFPSSPREARAVHEMMGAHTSSTSEHSTSMTESELMDSAPLKPTPKLK
jgi:hypothetical protein